jgi:Fic family protein
LDIVSIGLIIASLIETLESFGVIKMTNLFYQKVTNASRWEAQWDLKQPVKKVYIEKFGKGKGTYYKLKAK